MKTYKGYRIEIREIDRDWSEDAQEYSVPELGIKDECEGEDEAFEYAKQDIDQKLSS